MTMRTGNRRVDLQADLGNTTNLTRFIIPHLCNGYCGALRCGVSAA